MLAPPLRAVLLLACAGALGGCDLAPEAPVRAEEQPSQLSAPLQAPNAATTALYRVVETYFDQYLALNPITATTLGDHRFDDRFGDYASMSWMADSLGIEQESLERLQAIDPRQLSGEDLVTYEAFRRQREIGIAGYRYPSELLAIDPFVNWPLTFAHLGSGRGGHPFRSTRDYDAFLLRMDGFSAWVDQAINNLRAGLAKGVVLPKVIVTRTLPQLEAFGRIEDPRQSVFWQPLLSFPAGPTVDDRRRLLAAYEDRLRTRVLPAYRRLHDYLAQEYLPQARESVAWSDLPSGDLWYAHLVRLHTDSTQTPAEVHLLGVREVARLRANLDALLPALGAGGDPRAVFEALRAEPGFRIADARALLDAHAALRARVDAGLPALFARLPQAAVEIRPVEAFRSGTTAAVSSLAPDAARTRPAVIYVNTGELASSTAYELPEAFLREALPGRLFGTLLAQETTSLPRFRRYGSQPAIDEGWALYASSLGQELGLYADPAAHAAAIAHELAQAALLVVDTGLHAQGWGRERALDYLRANSVLAEPALAAAVDRCIARPGEALAATTGRLRIEQMRRAAEQRLGARFDLREFHEQVVGGGAVPFSALEAKLARWTEARR